MKLEDKISQFSITKSLASTKEIRALDLVVLVRYCPLILRFLRVIPASEIVDPLVFSLEIKMTSSGRVAIAWIIVELGESPYKHVPVGILSSPHKYIP
jgi:hypothetical protein